MSHMRTCRSYLYGKRITILKVPLLMTRVQLSPSRLLIVPTSVSSMRRRCKTMTVILGIRLEGRHPKICIISRLMLKLEDKVLRMKRSLYIKCRRLISMTKIAPRNKQLSHRNEQSHLKVIRKPSSVEKIAHLKYARPCKKAIPTTRVTMRTAQTISMEEVKSTANML